MTGIVIEYGRFIEAQKRRARVAARLNEVRETAVPHMSPSALDEVIEMREEVAAGPDLERAYAMPASRDPM